LVSSTSCSQTATRFPYTTLFRSLNESDTAPGLAMDSLDEGDDIIGGLGRVGQVLAHVDAHRDAAPAGLLQRPGGAEDIALHRARSEEHTSELQSRENLVCRLLLE